MKFIRDLTQKSRLFIGRDIWRTRLQTATPGQGLAIRIARITVLALHTFTQQQCALRASALTFYSILSIVPVAAMAFGVAAGFGLEQMLEKELLANFQGQEAVITQVIGFAHSLLANTKGGLIAGIGVAMLFYTVIMVLSHIENSLNAIWEITMPRSVGRKISDYLAMMIAAPLLFTISGSASVFIQTQVLMITQKLAILSLMGPGILFALKFLPLGLIWVLFSIVYLLMPNTRVRPLSGIIAGVVAGTVYMAVQWTYIHFQVGVARNNAVYGSFAALPLFLMWLQISWTILLAGAAISTACQKHGEQGFSPGHRNLSGQSRRLIGLCMAHLCVSRFLRGEPPPTDTEMVEHLGAPLSLIRSLGEELVQGRILSRVYVDGRSDFSFQPARDVSQLSLLSVIRALEAQGTDYRPEAGDGTVEKLAECLTAIDAFLEKSPVNRPLQSI